MFLGECISPADGYQHGVAQLPDSWQGEGCQPLQVGWEADEEDEVEEDVVDHHVAGHVHLRHHQPLELLGKGLVLPPGCWEEEADSDADGHEAR